MDDWLQSPAPAARFVLQGGPAMRAAAGSAFSVPLPERACRANTADGRAVLWLGPDEFLLLVPAGERAAAAAGLESALSGVAHSLVDVSQRQVAFEVQGPHAAAILNGGCPLDLDAAAFPSGMCTRTLFAKAEIVLWRTGAGTFRLEVWRSFADYVQGCLREIARDALSLPA